MNKRILYLIQQAGTALRMPRNHNKHLGTSYDTVASHSFHVAIIAYCICRMEKLSHEDGLKAMGIGVLHDLAEMRTGDFDLVAKHYGSADELKAIKDQFAGISFKKDLEKMLHDYEERKTIVEKCVKDADSIAQIFHEWSLMWQGNKLAERWFKSDFKDRVPNLRTESAKK